MLMKLFHKMMLWWLLVATIISGYISFVISKDEGLNLVESMEVFVPRFFIVTGVGLLVSIYVVIYKHFSQK